MKLILMMVMLIPFYSFGKDVECLGDQIGAVIDEVFKAEPKGDTNKGEIGEKKPSQVILHPMDAGEVRTICKAQIDDQVKQKKVASNAYWPGVDKCNSMSCNELAIKWVNDEKDNIVSKYAVSYQPEVMQNMARTGKIQFTNKCIVYSAEQMHSWMQCSNKSNQGQNFCLNEYICPDSQGNYSPLTSETIKLACPAQEGLKCNGIMYMDCFNTSAPIAPQLDKKSEKQLNERVGAQNE